MSPVRLRGRRIEKRYGRVAALRGVDLEITAGESIAILGANGAGKSSLLKILAGLSRPSAGVFDAIDETAGDMQTNAATDAATRPPLRRDELRAAVGYVGHATLLYGELTARENLRFAARLHNQSPDRDQLDKLLEDVALLEVADRQAGTFSRGMAQRLSIARAIVHNPALLLLDEPFTGLDELSAERLSEQLQTQKSSAGERSRSLVVVTHDPRRATELADRAIVLHYGRVRATPARNASSSADFEVDALRACLSELARESEADTLAAAAAAKAGTA